MTKDRISALFFLALCIAYWLLAQDIRVMPFARNDPVTPQTVPRALAIVGAIIAFLMLVLPPKGERPTGGPFDGWGLFAWGRVISLGLVMLAYGYLLTRVGFIISTSLFLIGGYLILGERRWAVILAASVPVVIVFWAILTQLLGLYLAPGSLWGQP